MALSEGFGKEDSSLGYIPISIFTGMSLLTLGLYPYMWIRGNLRFFERIGGGAGRSRKLRRFATVGFCVQSILIAAIFMYAAWLLLESERMLRLSSRFSMFYVVSYLLFVLPMRCGSLFAIRWRIRREVAFWDSGGIMTDRTMASWFRLFLFGSFYVQYHINRLMGLGMPDFGDQSEIASDLAPSRWLRDYVRPRR